MRNLYDEIVDKLLNYHKSIYDIRYIIMSDPTHEWWDEAKDELFEINIPNFMQIAKKTIYDSGYGGIEIPESLKIVGDDWWLERHEYDGAEWFEYKTLPALPQKTLVIKNIRFKDARDDDNEYV